MTVTTARGSAEPIGLTAVPSSDEGKASADTEGLAGVKEPLTPKGQPDISGSTEPRGRTRPSRRRPEVENPEYAAFVCRVVRAHARRIATGDVESLTDLLDLAGEIDTATRDAVTGLRAASYSWAEIAARTGTTRQAAQQRWGR